MILSTKSVLLILSVIGVASAGSGPALAGDCTGHVVGVKPISQYNHAKGTGFLAVRTGPGSSYQQTGEVYRGDEVSVYDRRGNWYAITCMSGQCMRPLWGQPTPSGWVSRTYIDAAGVCP
ncbi:SH3 domain-containing protein [Hoeflea sp. IMCC20628]|uniref:SH3 domain-containing protein n=1 Tax=Hoeflea sp. IMCC20628 TaxID=1620421 RepID=UPI00063BDB29|nr:SH3 domain-containing protein [Hoeflea sp. IMCC20628]AKH99578.1 SH3 domain-containing protein [Hoeflea sp. IMCC20628]